MSGVFQQAPVDWQVVAHLARELSVSTTAASVLAARGVTTPEHARELLRPQIDPASFHNPLLLGDMAAAVERIRFAIGDGQRIAVHGDYDADGMCATVLLVEALESIGADVVAFLPTRTIHGYGLSLDVVDQFAADGIRLIITVDCGITAIEPVRQAVERGMDVIVCDHHQPGAELPDAIICSTRPSNYPFPDLCATAVAGKLASALGADLGDAAHELEAIATVADCVPLVGENREIVRRGLAALRRTARPGLRALMSTCDVHARAADEEVIAFKLAPRLNASGRISDPERAYELLRAATPELAQSAAQTLHEINDRRRLIEQEILAEAEQQIATWSEAQRRRRLWVIAGDDWHEGVVGIVAARLVERYRRPMIVIGRSGALGRGSGRSIDGFDLHAAVKSADDLLVRWGGHHGAVGVTVDLACIDQLADRLATYAETMLRDEDMLPTCSVDAVLHPGDLSMQLVEELKAIAPFGQDNPKPVLLIPHATAQDASVVGQDARHLRGRLQIAGTTAPFIAFGQAEHAAECEPGRTLTVAATVSVNRFRGSETLQLELQQISSAQFTDTDPMLGCATSCNFTCTNRVDLGSVLAASSAPSARATITSHTDLASIASLAESASTVDLRGSTATVAQLVQSIVAAQSSVIVVCADVARRRDTILGDREQLRAAGCSHIVLASGRCNPAGIAERMRRAIAAGTNVVVLADEDAPLADLIAAGRGAGVSAIIVADPLTLDSSVDALSRGGIPSVLAYGSAETRFVLAAASAVADVRGTLGSAWRDLRDGVDSAAALEHVLFGGQDAPILHSPAAVAHALHVLRERGLVAVDAATCSITAMNPAAT